jgi:hypothetical protein
MIPTIGLRRRAAHSQNPLRRRSSRRACRSNVLTEPHRRTPRVGGDTLERRRTLRGGWLLSSIHACIGNAAAGSRGRTARPTASNGGRPHPAFGHALPDLARARNRSVSRERVDAGRRKIPFHTGSVIPAVETLVPGAASGDPDTVGRRPVDESAVCAARGYAPIRSQCDKTARLCAAIGRLDRVGRAPVGPKK